MILRSVAICTTVALLGACSAKRCVIDDDYLTAAPVGPLKNPVGYALPEPDPAYQIPELPDSKIVVERHADGKSKPCLDFPPAMPAQSVTAS